MPFTSLTDDNGALVEASLGTANAYVSVAWVDEYFTLRGRSDWDGTEARKQGYIIRATDHIEKRFGPRWKGTRKEASNALTWPRSGVVLKDGTAVAEDAIPEALRRACAEYARLAIERAELDPVSMEVDAEKTGKVRRKVVEQEVGPIRTKTDEE
ncbi:MAG: hypothetical protein OXC95_02125, partial [Dehalococcoidia bacterium]|nr:hypothetical protein [Dehalococcoidia bacterium]